MLFGLESSSQDLQERFLVAEALECRVAHMIDEAVLDDKVIVADSVHIFGGSPERENVMGRAMAGDHL